MIKVIYQKQLKVEIHNVSFHHNQQQWKIKNFTLLLTPATSKIRITGSWKPQLNSKIEIFGDWNTHSNNRKNRIHFNFYHVQIPLSFSLFQKIWSFYPLPRISLFQNILKSSFFLNGKGSIDVTPKGYAYHIYGNLYGLKAKLLFFHIQNLSGNIKFSQISSFDQSYLKQELLFRNQNNQINYIKLKDPKDHHFTINGNIYIDGHSISTPWNSNGKINFSFQGTKKRKQIQITSSIELTQFILLQKLYYPAIFIESAKIHTKIPNQFHIFLTGKISSQDFQYEGNLKFRFPESPIWSLKGDFKILKTNYQTILNDLMQIFQYYRKEAKKMDSPKYEDAGPVWENKFFLSDLYKIYIQNIHIDTKISLLHPLQNIPAIKGYGKTNNQTLSLFLSGTNHQIPSYIKINYTIHYLEMIPSHYLEIFIQLSNPQIELPFFCNHCKNIIKNIDFYYTSNSNGIYVADYYLNNSSHLNFKIHSIRITKDYRNEIITKFLNIPNQKAVQLDLEYSSYGASYNPIQIKLENSLFHLQGYGSYNIFSGGKMNFYLYDKQKHFTRNFIIKIRKDGVWIPSHFF